MKKFYLLASIVLSALTFTGCSDDDQTGLMEEMDGTVIRGTYKLVAVNTEQPTDYNMDGKASINQMEESPCYTTANINFSGIYDKFTYNRHFLAVNEEQGIALCDDVTLMGDFVRIEGGYTNGKFRLTYINGSGDTRTMDFIKEGTKLTYIDQYGSYPDRTPEGVPTRTPGVIEYVFEKVKN